MSEPQARKPVGTAKPAATAAPAATNPDDDLLEFLGSLDDDTDDAGEWLQFLSRTDLDKAINTRTPTSTTVRKPGPAAAARPEAKP